ncbi:hypothetical protein D6D01_05547 [Aureobasidium pullulans]|uniref:Uncharacterized protein n=1 Tax=Aureobasidium pullulans TaxID=5580 RepID=A0A4S9L561_AURPU|nr:hypothetical protein D6D01_05547 [Aureobasidium pullulans]
MSMLARETRLRFEEKNGTLRGCVKAMSDNLPIPSSDKFPHAGHFLHRNRNRNRKLLRIERLQILIVDLVYFFDRNRNLLRINQLQIIPVTVNLILRIHLENTEWPTDRQEQW